MDPTQALIDLVEAIDDGDRRQAHEITEDLRGWLASGGFHPCVSAVAACMGVDSARSLRSALKRTGLPYAESVRRVRLDRNGYEPGGRYWGTGAPLYRVQTDNGRAYYYRAPNGVSALHAHHRA